MTPLALVQLGLFCVLAFGVSVFCHWRIRQCVWASLVAGTICTSLMLTMSGVRAAIEHSDALAVLRFNPMWLMLFLVLWGTVSLVFASLVGLPFLVVRIQGGQSRCWY